MINITKTNQLTLTTKFPTDKRLSDNKARENASPYEIKL